MNRRNFLQSAAISLASCTKKSQPQLVTLNAGPFSVAMPQGWAKSAIVEKIALHPLYSAVEWAVYQKDKMYSVKPAYACRPTHWAIRLPEALPEGIPFDGKNAGDDATAPQILIHKADEWGVAFTDGVHEEVKRTDVIKRLRETMEAALNYYDPQLSPGYTDASLEFQCLKRKINFKGGHGIRLVTQWNIEADFVTFGELHYLFLGMSDDNTCQIMATFPLDLPGLPKRGDDIHLGWSKRDYPKFEADVARYEASAKKWLESNADKISPSLQTLDLMMESLVVKEWQS
jgi:hypothetical protein